MILEDLGVKAESFLELRELAVADVKMIAHSSSSFRKVLDDHELGNVFNLPFILKHIEHAGLDSHTPEIDTLFLQQVREVATSTIMRDIKHSARIPVPGSYLLVGVIDEGTAYSVSDVDPQLDIYTLQEGHIYGTVNV